MNKQTLITIVITATLTFFGTLLFLPYNHEITGHAEHHDEHGDEHGKKHSPDLSYSPEILKEFDIQIGTVSGGVLEEIIDLPGEIQIDPDRLAHVTPRFDGIVKEVFKQIGDRVKKDELLAIIESNESLTPYELRSSIEGIVIDMHFTKGETTQGPDHFFAVADLSKVWVNLSVYQKYLPRFSIGQTVNILLSSDIPPVSGKISYISPTLDENTRTATARVILKNKGSKFRPGQFITGQVVVNRTNCEIIIPKTALEMINDQPVIFVRDEHGFEPVQVKIGKDNNHSVEILSGLMSGEKYVKKGGFILKAQLEKGSFGGGHSH